MEKYEKILESFYEKHKKEFNELGVSHDEFEGLLADSISEGMSKLELVEQILILEGKYEPESVTDRAEVVLEYITSGSGAESDED